MGAGGADAKPLWRIINVCAEEDRGYDAELFGGAEHVVRLGLDRGHARRKAEGLVRWELYKASACRIALLFQRCIGAKIDEETRIGGSATAEPPSNPFTKMPADLLMKMGS